MQLVALNQVINPPSSPINQPVNVAQKKVSPLEVDPVKVMKLEGFIGDFQDELKQLVSIPGNSIDKTSTWKQMVPIVNRYADRIDKVFPKDVSMQKLAISNLYRSAYKAFGSDTPIAQFRLKLLGHGILFLNGSLDRQDSIESQRQSFLVNAPLKLFFRLNETPVMRLNGAEHPGLREIFQDKEIKWDQLSYPVYQIDPRDAQSWFDQNSAMTTNVGVGLTKGPSTFIAYDPKERAMPGYIAVNELAGAVLMDLYPEFTNHRGIELTRKDGRVIRVDSLTGHELVSDAASMLESKEGLEFIVKMHLSVPRQLARESYLESWQLLNQTYVDILNKYKLKFVPNVELVVKDRDKVVETVRKGLSDEAKSKGIAIDVYQEFLDELKSRFVKRAKDITDVARIINMQSKIEGQKE